jgi:hypothetical protein
MKTAEELLEESVQQYREMLAQINMVQRAVLKPDNDKILELSALMRETQQKARTIESELAPYIEQYPELGKSTLYRERMTLAEQILQIKEALLPKCQGILAINRDELAKIANGRVLMRGYHSNLQKKGQFIKTAK